MARGQRFGLFGQELIDFYFMKQIVRKRVLKRDFFEQNTLLVAEKLLGKFLCRKLNGRILCGKIIETEAYRGEYDLACHACRGKTKRTEIMYGRAGYAYVYLCYGMHWMLNIVTEKKNFPAAVLIRSLEICEDGNEKVLNGPGKITKFLKINKEMNGEDLTNSDKLWVEDWGGYVKKSEIRRTPRIGVGYAKHCSRWRWRFVLKDMVDKTGR